MGYAFDIANRLSAVTGLQSYRYDGQGRRVETIDANGTITYWMYDQAGQVVYATEGRRSRNIAYYYLGNTQIATRAEAMSSGTITMRLEYNDALGSPVVETDTVGVVKNRYAYTPWGENAVIDGTGYTGHVMDQATGLTYMQQRYYDPQIGRFLSVDPMAVNTDNAINFNRYDYAANNPYKFTDPDGRTVNEVLGTLVGKKPDPAPDKSSAENSGRQQIAGSIQRGNHSAVESAKADIKAIPGKIADIGVCAFKAVVGADPGEIAGNVTAETTTSALEHSGKTLGVKEISEVSKVLGFVVKLAPIADAVMGINTVKDFSVCTGSIVLPTPGERE